MKLVTFRLSGESLSAARAGVLLPYGVVDLQAAAPLVFEDEESEGRPLDMLRLLDGSDEGLGIDGAAAIVDAVLDQLGGAVVVRGVVDDLDDTDNIVAVISELPGVESVRDETTVLGL